MDDPALRQQVEFLQLQLTDSKKKEDRLKEMYDLLLASVGAQAPERGCDEKALEDKHAREVETLKEEFAAKIRDLEDRLKQALDAQRDSEFSLRTQKLSYEESILELKQQIYQLNNDKSQLALRLKLTSTPAAP